MINLIISDSQKLLNGLELMKEFRIKPNYTDIQVLYQHVSKAKKIIERQIEICKKQKENEITN